MAITQQRRKHKYIAIAIQNDTQKMTKMYQQIEGHL